MHVPCCHLWPALLYYIFPHYLINGTIFEKKLVYVKHVFWFSLQLLSETIYSKKNWARYNKKFILVFTLSAIYSWTVLKKLEFSGQFFLKILRFHISLKSVWWELSCFLQTDGQTYMTELIVASLNFANTPKNKNRVMWIIFLCTGQNAIINGHLSTSGNSDQW
jgi:hypothetical protein